MESNGVRKLYEPSPVPTLYVGRILDLLGRVFPCMAQKSFPIAAAVIKVFSRSLYIYLMTLFRRLTARVDQITPPHISKLGG